MSLGIYKEKSGDTELFKIGHNPTDAKTTMGYKTEADAQFALDNMSGPKQSKGVQKATQPSQTTATVTGHVERDPVTNDIIA